MDRTRDRRAVGRESRKGNTRKTAYLVLSVVRYRDHSPEEGREAIDAMIDCGWYVAPDVYTKIVQKLESFE